MWVNFGLDGVGVELEMMRGKWRLGAKWTSVRLEGKGKQLELW